MPELLHGGRVSGYGVRTLALLATLWIGAAGWARSQEPEPATPPAPAVAAKPGKADARPGCAAVTKAGNPCTRKARDDSTYCTQHARIHGEEVVVKTVSTKAPVKGDPRPVVECPVFVALDVETADMKGAAPCALAIIRYEGGREVKRAYSLIDPETEAFNPHSVRLHKITPERVKGQPTFAAFWQEAAPLLEGATFIAAHNAGFDRAVIAKACARFGIEPPAAPYVCSSRASKALGTSGRLKEACDHLNIALDEHQADSDAAASGQIVIQAFSRGFDPTAFRLKSEYRAPDKTDAANRTTTEESEPPRTM